MRKFFNVCGNTSGENIARNASDVSMVCEFWLQQFLNFSYITAVHNGSQIWD